MRRLLIKHFALGTWIVLFGRQIHTLRAPRILFPLTVLVGIIIAHDPYDFSIQWYDILALIVLFAGYSLGFNFFPWSYFKNNPAQYDELDLEQRSDYIRGIEAGALKNPYTNKFGLDGFDVDELIEVSSITAGRLDRNFVNLESLLPPIISLAAIVLWYILNL